MNKEQRRALNSKAKNCPFCGAPAYVECNSRGFINGKSTKVTFVRCSSCFARTGKYDLNNPRFTPAQSRQLAIDAWNYRYNEDNNENL